MTLDERLARDAAQWRSGDRAPDLADFVTAATARGVARPARAGTWLAVAVAVVVAVGVAVGVVVAVVVTHVARSAPAASPPPQDRFVRVTDIVPTAVIGDVRSPDLTIQVPCPVDQAGASVRADASSVTVRVYGYQLRGHDCGAGPTQLSIRLKNNLGHRSVRCACTPHQIPLLTSELPVPRELPSGYVADSGHAATHGIDYLDPAGNVLTTDRQYRRGTDRLYVYVGLAAQLAPALHPPAGTVAVDGHQATITTEGGTCVSWHIRTGVLTSVCSTGPSSAPLSVHEVVRIARSLH